MSEVRIGYWSVVLAYLGVFAIVLGVNLMPAFGPPTWTILVLYRFRSDLAPVAAAVVRGAAAAPPGGAARPVLFRPVAAAVGTAVRGGRSDRRAAAAADGRILPRPHRQ